MLFAAVVSMTSAARADDARTQQCIQAYDAGQKLHKTGDLLEAAMRLAFCADQMCPSLIRQDCSARLTIVKQATPTVWLTVEFQGQRRPVRVSIDGKAMAWSPEAKQLVVNPGRHSVRVEAEGMVAQTRSILVGDGDKDVAVKFLFPTEPATPARQASASSTGAADSANAEQRTTGTTLRTAALATAGVGLLGLGGFAYFGLHARSEEDRLIKDCSPACTESRVSDVRRSYLLANAGLGLSIASLATAGILFYLHRSDGASDPAPSARLGLRVGASQLRITGEF